MKKLWLFSIILAGLAGCAHESTITPSQGHIGSGEEAQAAAPVGDIPKPIKKPGYVPPPKPKTKEQTYSVVVSDVPVREILFALARESKVNVDIHPGITGNVTLNAVDQTLPAILDRISRQVDLRYKLEGNVLSITPDIPTLRTYKINYVNIDRNTDSSIGVAAEISSTGSSAAADGSSSSGSSGNSSKTTVSSKSKNNFWDLLADNIRIILKTTKTQTANAEDRAARAEAIRASQEDRLKQVEAVSKAGAGAEKLFQEAFKSQPSNFESKDEVIINPVAGTLTVMGTERQQGFIQQYLDTVMASAQRQVLIEATIVEVKLSDQFSTGIDWSRLGPSGLTFDQSLSGGSLLNSTSKFIIGYTQNRTILGTLAGQIRLLEGFGKTKVLSSPKLMALNNQTAILKVVDNLVYFTIKADTTTNQIGSQTTFTTTPHTVPVGVVMSLTPQINENGSVTLTVRPTISREFGKRIPDPNPALKDKTLSTDITSEIPQIQVREMESMLQAQSGQTVVLGGLMQDDIQTNTENVPLASKLPLIGKLFQGKDNQGSKSELVIFLRPTVIPNASLESDELKSFKQFLPDQLPVVTTDEPAN
jgi:MSHA type pilus biogenesis protein MshL